MIFYEMKNVCDDNYLWIKNTSTLKQKFCFSKLKVDECEVGGTSYNLIIALNKHIPLNSWAINDGKNIK